MRNLQEANKIYTQRYREKKRAELGNDNYKEKRAEYMRSYRDKRFKEEGYVKPSIVKEVPKKVRKTIQKKEVISKPVEVINTNTKKGKKSQKSIEIQKSQLSLSTLSESSLTTYISHLQTTHRLMMGSDFNSKLKQEIVKVLKAGSYDEEFIGKEMPYIKKDKIKNTIQSIRDEFPNDNTYKAKVGGLASFLGRLKNYDTEYKYASETGIDEQNKYTEKRDKNEINKDDLDTIKLIKFDEKEIRKNLSKLDNDNEKALYAIYMYIPRRLEVRTVKVRFNEKDTDKENYIILQTQTKMIPDKFIFNVYKTDKTYGKQVVQIPDDIKDIIHTYILNKKLKANEYLFPLFRSNKEPHDEGAFSKFFTKVFSKVYDRRVTNQFLRVAYATYWTPKAKNLAEKKKFANDLSHDYMTHEQYLKYNIEAEN